MSKALTSEEFFLKCSQVHENFYDYSRTVFTRLKDPILVRCPLHGLFKIRAGKHYSGQKCRECWRSNFYSRDSYSKIALEVYSLGYTYEKLPESFRLGEVITLTCPVHGDQKVNSYYHLRQGRVCPECVKKADVRFTEIFNSLPKTLQYEIVGEGTGGSTLVRVTCPDHGVFKERSLTLVSRQPCVKCSKVRKRKEKQENYLKLMNESYPHYSYSFEGDVFVTMCHILSHGVTRRNLKSLRTIIPSLPCKKCRSNNSSLCKSSSSLRRSSRGKGKSVTFSQMFKEDSFNFVKFSPPLVSKPEKARLKSGVNDLLSLYPILCGEALFDPALVYSYSTRDEWWSCLLCDSRWKASPRSRTKAFAPTVGCPSCSRARALEERSSSKLLKIVHPELATQIIDKNLLEDLTFSSWKVIEWSCENGYPHTYELSVNDRVGGLGCPYCSFRKLLPEFNSLKAVSPYLVDELKDESLAERILANSRISVAWTHFSRSGILHEWSSSPNFRVFEGSGCLVCNGKQVQVGVNDFGSFLETSDFVWSSSNSFEPETITFGSTKIVFLECVNHPTPVLLSARAKDFSSGKKVCVDCASVSFVSVGELEVLSFLRDSFPSISFESGVRRFKKFGLYECDVYSEELKVAVDFNGEYWHQEGVFKPVGYHREKLELARSIGISLVFVWESDWKDSRELVEEALIDFLKNNIIHPILSKLE